LARSYVRGLLAPLASKNGWTLAEAAASTGILDALHRRFEVCNLHPDQVQPLTARVGVPLSQVHEALQRAVIPHRLNHLEHGALIGAQHDAPESRAVACY
jgi:hypothetical protein